MSTSLLQRSTFRIPLTTGPFHVCILYKDRWHVTSVDKPFEDVVALAENAYERSGLPVQIRDLDETILFEANDENEWPQALTSALTETRSW